MFDYAIHESGDFDAVTNVWIHTVFAVTKTSLWTYDDGRRVNDDGCATGTSFCPYAFYTTSGVGPSLADSGLAYPRRL